MLPYLDHIGKGTFHLLIDGIVPIQAAILLQVADTQPVLDGDFPFIRHKLSCNQPQEGGFSRPIGANDTDALRRLNIFCTIFYNQVGTEVFGHRLK